MRAHRSFARLLTVLTLTLAASLAACSPKATPMTPEETQRIEALTVNMTPRCIGRYLVDMPERFVLNSESSTEIEGVKIEVKPIDKFLFQLTLEARETVLTQTNFSGSESALPFLRKTIPLPAPSLGVLFDRARSVNEGRLGRTLEILAWRDGFMITASIDARDTTFPEDAGDPIVKQLSHNVSEKLAHLLAVFERVSGRKDTEIPSAPGLCIPNGFVAGPSREDQETDAVYHLAGAPDVWFGFGSSDKIKEKDTLLQRAPEVEKAMKEDGTRTLRKGKRTVHSQAYEELLLGNTLEQDGVRGVQFMLFGNELRTEPEQPFIDFSFYNGDRIPVGELTMEQKDKLRLNKMLSKATLSEAEALAIWDKVSATLRPRPEAF